MMGGHTPGPWRAGWEDYEPYVSPNICRHVNKTNPQYKGNARLIAAAPDLLDAATAMLEAFGEEVWVGKQAMALDILMDAIKKAEGSGRDA